MAMEIINASMGEDARVLISTDSKARIRPPGADEVKPHSLIQPVTRSFVTHEYLPSATFSAYSIFSNRA
jgi:hypothetical protein